MAVAVAYVSLREKSMGKAVPTSATATAPAMRYVLPSAATSPTAETATSRPAAPVVLFLIIDGGNDDAAPRGGSSCGPAAEQRAVAGALTMAAIVRLLLVGYLVLTGAREMDGFKEWTCVLAG